MSEPITVKGRFGCVYIYTPGSGIVCVDWSYAIRDGELTTVDRPYPVSLEEMPEGPRKEMDSLQRKARAYRERVKALGIESEQHFDTRWEE
jgi:hypothetical protein